MTAINNHKLTIDQQRQILDTMDQDEFDHQYDLYCALADQGRGDQSTFADIFARCIAEGHLL